MTTCPWDGLRPAILSFCEANLCEWVKQPANTYSNLAYVGVGLWIWFGERKTAVPAVRSLGLVSILIGFTSALYHASAAFFAEVLDVGSMFLMSSGCIVLNLVRLKLVPTHRWVGTFAALVAPSIALMVFTPIRGIDIFALQVFAVAFLEFKLYRREGGAIRYRPWLVGIGLLVLAYAIWLTDYHRIVCAPDVHWISGHALWHVTNSFVFLYAFRFYEQFPELRREPA